MNERYTIFISNSPIHIRATHDIYKYSDISTMNSSEERHHFQSMAGQLDTCRSELQDLLAFQTDLIESLGVGNDTLSKRPEITRIHTVMSKIPKYLKKIENLRRDMKEVDAKMRWTKATCVRAWQKHQKTLEREEEKKKTPTKKKKVVMVEAPRVNTTQITPSIQKSQSVECIKVVKKKTKKKKRRVVLDD